MKKFILVLIVLFSTLVTEVYSLNRATKVIIEKDKMWEPQITSPLDALSNNHTVNLLLNEKQFLLQTKKEELSLVFSLLILSVTLLLVLIFFTFFRSSIIKNIQYI
jgi:hypothetical protein